MKRVQLYKYLDLIEEALTEISAKNIDNEERLNVLTECQQCALKIGNDIEQQENGKDYIIPLLEELCEELYQTSLILQEYRIFVKKIKRLQGLLLNIRNGIKNQIPPDVKKVFFMPYKVSMWDSMESIWKAACENPNVECHVVPIPYFERNSRGELDRMHYEGLDYPEYVSIESWQDVLLEVEKPDVVFIHNVFDQYNYVTCVHPAFFTKEIKKHTDRLVYIPYFFTNKIYSDTHLNIPGYKYCDDIIVQNDMVVKQFMGQEFEKKVISLGSPKLDCLLNYSNENRYPKELEKYKSEGRKIVLLNTSISSFLKDSDKMIKKVFSVLSEISKEDNILLVWRPHPLLEQTINSMVPEQKEAFQECKKAFEKNKEFIFDTHMNLDELVVACDAYLGEIDSSLVVMFASMGKPIFIIDSHRVNMEDYNEFFFDFYKEGEELFFAHGKYSAICHANINNGLIDEIYEVDCENFQGFRAYTEVVENKGKLYFTPMHANKTVGFDLSTKKIDMKSIKDSKFSNYNHSIKKEGYLWCIPTLNNSILKWDLDDGTQEYHRKPINLIKRNFREKGFYSMFASCCIDNSIYIATPTSNLIVRYDVYTNVTEEFFVGNKNQGYWHMIYDGIFMWLLPYRGRAIVRWELLTNKVEEFDNYPEDFMKLEEEKDYFIQFADCDEFLLAFPKRANMIIKIEKNSGAITKWDLKLPYREGDRKNEDYWWQSNYYFVKKFGDYIYAMTAYDNALLEINYKDNSFRRMEFKFKEGINKKCIEKDYRCKTIHTLEDCYYRESTGGALITFLQGLKNGEVAISAEEQDMLFKIMKNTDGTVGEKILEFVIRE